MDVLEHVAPSPKRLLWAWFKEHAKSRWALAWLGLVAFADTLFSPITAEAFLTVLLLAHRDRWRAYLPTALFFSTLGAAAGYCAFYFAYRAFGEALLASWGFAGAYTAAQGLLGTHIFLAMLVAAFTPLPDKAFIYAAGILGAPFAPFIGGFIIGRGMRMSVVTYVVWKFGEPVLEMMDQYAVYATLAAVALFALYAIVKFNLLPL
ncbi:MAG TPA: VTT domain-containing protein [Candidatus Paceibacterota bacterium]